MFLILICFIIFKKISVVNSVKIKANADLTNKLDEGIKMTPINNPSFVPSIVPAVVGATNLFCVICCIINPDILNPIPDSIIDNVLGILLTTNTITSAGSLFIISINEMSLAPRNNEIVLKINNNRKVYNSLDKA